LVVAAVAAEAVAVVAAGVGASLEPAAGATRATRGAGADVVGGALPWDNVVASTAAATGAVTMATLVWECAGTAGFDAGCCSGG
jgi:hypothetical protein